MKSCVKQKFMKIPFLGEDDSGPIDEALASGDEEAAKNLNNVRIKFDYNVIVTQSTFL